MPTKFCSENHKRRKDHLGVDLCGNIKIILNGSRLGGRIRSNDWLLQTQGWTFKFPENGISGPAE
jgi:hypothetical protein